MMRRIAACAFASRRAPLAHLRHRPSTAARRPPAIKNGTRRRSSSRKRASRSAAQSTSIRLPTHRRKNASEQKYFSKVDDGLTREWFGRVWLNPPYAQPGIERFIDKLIGELAASRVTAAILLTNSFTGTKWFRRAATAATALCFTTGRIRFVAPDGEKLASPALGQVFFFFGEDAQRFAAAFGDVGVVFPKPLAGLSPDSPLEREAEKAAS